MTTQHDANKVRAEIKHYRDLFTKTGDPHLIELARVAEDYQILFLRDTFRDITGKATE